MMSSIILSSPPSSGSKRSSLTGQSSANLRICPACRNPVTATRAPRNARPGLALPICGCNPNKSNPLLVEKFTGRIQMRREREKARVYEPYSGANESDIYAETTKAGKGKSPVQIRGAWKERERKEVGAQQLEDVSDEGHGNDDGFEDVDLAEGEAKKVADAEEEKEGEEEGHEGYGAESREESDDDLMDDGFVIVEKYEGMVAEEDLGGGQTSQAPGYWKLARAATRKLGW